MPASYSAPPVRLVIGGVYFFYFAILGVFIPYLSVYLDKLSWSSSEIGAALALVTATRVVGPSLWASIADKTGALKAIIQVGIGLAFIAFAVFSQLQSFWGVTLLLALYSMFWTAVLPQLETLTLSSVANDAKGYSRLRAMGSIGYIFLVVIAGMALEDDASHFVWMLLAMQLLLLALTVLLPKTPKRSAQHVTDKLWPQLSKAGVWPFFAAALLLQLSFSPFYGFYALYGKQLGYSGLATGLLIAVGVLAEIGVFWFAGKWLARRAITSLMVGCMLLTALRWGLTGWFGDSLTVMLLCQLSHAASFGLVHACSMQFIARSFSPSTQARAQAFYAGAALGVGGALGSWIAGLYWQQGSGALWVWSGAAVVALLAALMAHQTQEPRLQATA